MGVCQDIVLFIHLLSLDSSAYLAALIQAFLFQEFLSVFPTFSSMVSITLSKLHTHTMHRHTHTRCTATGTHTERHTQMMHSQRHRHTHTEEGEI